MVTATTTYKRAAANGMAFLRKLSDDERATYARIPEEIDFVPHPSFQLASTEGRLFGEDAETVNVPQWTQYPEVPEEIAPRQRGKATLSDEDEAKLFLSYNYARYRLAKLIDAQTRRKSATRAREMARWYARALKCRANIVRANMALVLAMAKRTRIPNVDFTEIVSEGNMALLRSVEKFDVSRGFKFSTYACRAILKSFNRQATKTGRYRQHFPTEYDPEFDRSDYDLKKHDMQLAESIDSLREILSRNGAKLSDVERTIVLERFAMGSHKKKRTLAEVGQMVGLTNERVRQIQNVALSKLRMALDESYLKV